MRHDETLTTRAGIVYGFMLAPGNHGFSTTTNPFASKSATGDRTYSDYEATAALALSDLSGGLGQDRLISATKYWTGRNIDTRGRRTVLGPYQHEITGIGLNSQVSAELALATTTWQAVYTTAYQRVATKFIPITTGAMDHFLILLKKTVGAGAVTVMVKTDVAGLPGVAMDTQTVSEQSVFGSWMKITVTLSTPITLNAGTPYWVEVTHAGTDTGAVAWGWATTGTSVYWNGSAYVALAGQGIFWYEDAETQPDTQPTFLTGSGEDGVQRTWLWAGRRLYYIDAASTVQPVLIGGAAFEAPNEITSVAWFKGTGDSHRYLYIALGASTDGLKFDADLLGTPTMSTVTGSKAEILTVHDNKLWKSLSGAVTYSTNGSTWAGSAGEVGDSSYPVRSLLSWNGALWAGCIDGLFKITYSGTTLTVLKQLDFTPLAEASNFSMMVVHQGDLWFNVASGIIRYTTGGVVTPTAPEIGVNINENERRTYRAAVSTVTTLFVAGEATPGNETTILAYAENGWHPIITLPRAGESCRSLAIDPSLYGASPRLWYGAGLQVAYAVMPTASQLRWTYADADYEASGEFTSSWFDTNLQTINKDWMTLQVHADGLAVDHQEIVIAYQMTEGGVWTTLGNAVVSGISSFSFPVDSYGPKIRLKLTLTTDDYTKTPNLIAVVLKFLERPDAVHTHLRTYRMGPGVADRNGNALQTSVAQCITNLQALASEKEPLSWRAWYGTVRAAHIIMYNATEIRSEQIQGGDEGSITVVVRLQEV